MTSGEKAFGGTEEEEHPEWGTLGAWAPWRRVTACPYQVTFDPWAAAMGSPSPWNPTVKMGWDRESPPWARGIIRAPLTPSPVAGGTSGLFTGPVRTSCRWGWK